MRGGLLSYFVIVCFVLGAVLGNWCIPALGTRMILVGAGLLAVCFFVMFIDRERRHVEELVEGDLEADLAGETARPREAGQLRGIAAAEERLEEREAERIERRMGQDIEIDVMHELGLTGQEGARPEGALERQVERDVERQIEERLRSDIKRGGWRAGK